MKRRESYVNNNKNSAIGFPSKANVNVQEKFQKINYFEISSKILLVKKESC